MSDDRSCDDAIACVSAADGGQIALVDPIRSLNRPASPDKYFGAADLEHRLRKQTVNSQ